MAHTKTAVEAILRGDPSLSGSVIDAALAVLDGKTAAGVALDMGELDRSLSRQQVAEILHCTPHTVTDYARKGLIRPFRFGARGTRAAGYSAQSVRELMERKRGEVAA